MLNKDNEIKSKVKNLIGSNLVILFFFLIWFSYSTFSFIFNFILFCSSLLIISCLLLIKKFKGGKKVELFSFYGLLIFILIFFLLDSVYVLIPDVRTFLFSFYNLIGLKHKFDLILFSILLLLIFAKLSSILFYFMKKSKNS